MPGARGAPHRSRAGRDRQGHLHGSTFKGTCDVNGILTLPHAAHQTQPVYLRPSGRKRTMPKKHPIWGTVARDDARRDARDDDTRNDRSRSGTSNRKAGRPAGPSAGRDEGTRGRSGGPGTGKGGRPGERQDSRPERRGGGPGEKRQGDRPDGRQDRRQDGRGRPDRQAKQDRQDRPGRTPFRDRAADARPEAAFDAPESPCSILPGIKPVLELLEADPSRVEAVFIRKGKRGREVDRIVELCREARVRFIFAEPHALDRLFASGQAIGQAGQATAQPAESIAEPDMAERQADDDLFADDDEAWDILEGNDADEARAPRDSRPAHPASPSHQGVIARVFDAGFAELGDILRDAPDAPLPLIVALDQVQDPGNVGTLARTLYAMGAAGLIVVRHGGAALGGAAARAAAGALEKLPVTKVTNLARALDEADEAGYTIYAAGGATTDGDGKPGTAPLNPFTEPLRTPAVLVLGNEDTGIRPNVAKRCHFTLSIPMARDFDSLNVAQAGAILVGCFAARRHKG